MHFSFLYSLSDHSKIIPALLGPKIDEVKIGTRYILTNIYFGFMNGGIIESFKAKSGFLLINIVFVTHIMFTEQYYRSRSLVIV